jgi:hypothetical protein
MERLFIFECKSMEATTHRKGERIVRDKVCCQALAIFNLESIFSIT